MDLGAVVPFDQYRRAMSQLMKRHGVDWVGLDRTYRRHSVLGRDGCGALRDLLERHYGNEGVPDEVVEARCADLLVDAGLPAPVHQFEVRRPDGTIARFDLAYPELRIAIETDGKGHGDEPIRLHDNRRRNAVQLLGWDVYHFSWEEVTYEPERVVATGRGGHSAAGWWVGEEGPPATRSPRCNAVAVTTRTDRPGRPRRRSRRGGRA